MKRVYGYTKTNLTLSEKAQAVYSASDPLKIIENDDGTYDMEGVYTITGLTADEVNRLLEDDYNLVMEDDEK